MFKKLYVRNNKQRLLLVVAEPVKNHLEIIMVIETSKVKKYL